VFLIDKGTAICCAGGLNDFYGLYNELRDEIRKYSGFSKRALSVRSIAHVARRLIYSKYGSAHVIIAGVGADDIQDKDGDNDDDEDDEDMEGGGEFFLCEILPGGTKVCEDIVLAGSGAPLVAPLVNGLFSSQPMQHQEVQQRLTVADSTERIRRALDAAKRLDSKSGGESAFWTLQRSENESSEQSE
jgi:20S proteasome alpha/beta subunit